MTTETIESLRAEVERLNRHYQAALEAEQVRANQVATLEANNARLREALKSLILATKHLNPCPGTVEMCLEALNATKEQP